MTTLLIRSVFSQAELLLRPLGVAHLAKMSSNSSTSTHLRLLGQEEAANIDQELFNDYGFSVDQLMELAGQACAHAVCKAYPNTKGTALIVAGPGNNGGDGLVCARHLAILNQGLTPKVFYPKPTQKPLYEGLVKQCTKMGIEFLEELGPPEQVRAHHSIIVDALFGFSFKGEPRPYAADILATVKASGLPVLSIDIPSGWDVEQGDVNNIGIMPDVLVSLTAPKKCARYFSGRHYLGGRFVPDAMQRERNLTLPPYPALDQIVEIDHISLLD